MKQQLEKLAVSPEAGGQMIDRGKSFVYAHIKAGNIKTVQFGDGIRIPMEEMHRIVREGLPSLKKDKAAA